MNRSIDDNRCIDIFKCLSGPAKALDPRGDQCHNMIDLSVTNSVNMRRDHGKSVHNINYDYETIDLS